MMFGPKYIQGCMVAFLLLTILSGILDGVYLGNSDYGTIETLTGWTTKSFGVFTVPLVMIGFIAALPQMLVWDYSFFHSLGAAGALIRIVLFAMVSVGFVWGFFSVLLPIALQLLANLARGILGIFTRF